MTTLTSLMQPGHPSGIVEAAPGRAVAALSAAGWRVAEMRADDRATLLAEAARALGLPEAPVRNLDAFLDSLRDVSGPVALVWRGWELMRERHPRDWEAARTVFRQRCDERSGFALVLATD